MFQLMLFILMSVVQAYLAPKPNVTNAKPSGLDEFDIPTAQSGRAVPVVYGTRKIDGANCVWYGDLGTQAITKSSGGGLFSKKVTQTVGYKYSVGMQLAVCKGFSEWELANGSGLFEIMFDDKHCERFNKPPNTVDTSILVGFRLVQKSGNRYDETEVNAGTAAQYRSVYISDVNLFGGEEKDGGIAGPIRFYYGLQDQLADAYLTANFGEVAPAYRGYCTAVFEKFYIGTRNSIRPVSFVVRRFPGAFCAGYHNIDGNANPIGVIGDLLTNKEYGLGFELSEIGPTFPIVAQSLYNEGLGVSFLFDSQKSASDVISEILQHIDAVIYTNPYTSALEIALNRNDYSVPALLHLDEDAVISLKLERKSWEELTNEIEIKFINRDNNYKEDSLIVRNPANIAARSGQVKRQSYEMYGFNNRVMAAKIGARLLRMESYPTAKITLTTNRIAWDLRPGAVVKVSQSDLGISEMACRVVTIKGGDIADGTVELELVEDIFGTTATGYSVEESTWTAPDAEAVPLLRAEMFEAPYQILGEEDTNVFALGSRANGYTVGYAIAEESGGLIIQNNETQALATSAKVKVAVTKTDTTITLKSVVDASQIKTTTDPGSAVNLAKIGTEIVAFGGLELISGEYKLTNVIRGVYGTLPSNHSVDDTLFVLPNAFIQENPVADLSTIVRRFLPFTPTDVVLWQDVTDITLTTNMKARRPQLPANIKVNGSYEPAVVMGDAVATWSHRNKFAEFASKRATGYYDPASIGGVDGEYRVEWLVDGTTIKSETVTSLTATLTYAEKLAADPSEALPVTFVLWSVSNGLPSAIVYTHVFEMNP